MPASSVHFRGLRGIFSCKRFGVTTEDPEKVTCKHCRKNMARMSEDALAERPCMTCLVRRGDHCGGACRLRFVFGSGIRRHCCGTWKGL